MFANLLGALLDRLEVKSVKIFCIVLSLFLSCICKYTHTHTHIYIYICEEEDRYRRIGRKRIGWLHFKYSKNSVCFNRLKTVFGRIHIFIIFLFFGQCILSPSWLIQTDPFLFFILLNFLIFGLWLFYCFFFLPSPSPTPFFCGGVFRNGHHFPQPTLTTGLWSPPFFCCIVDVFIASELVTFIDAINPKSVPLDYVAKEPKQKFFRPVFEWHHLPIRRARPSRKFFSFSK